MAKPAWLLILPPRPPVFLQFSKFSVANHIIHRELKHLSNITPADLLKQGMTVY